MCPIEKVVVISVCDVLFFITKLSSFRTQVREGSGGRGVMVVSHSRALELCSRIWKRHVPLHTFSCSFSVFIQSCFCLLLIRKNDCFCFITQK